MDQGVRRHYRAWKTSYLRNAGGEYWVKYDGTNSTVSEAHGYGMVLAAYMADKAILNSMFRYFEAHQSGLTPHLWRGSRRWRVARWSIPKAVIRPPMAISTLPMRCCWRTSSGDRAAPSTTGPKRSMCCMPS